MCFNSYEALVQAIYRWIFSAQNTRGQSEQCRIFSASNGRQDQLRCVTSCKAKIIQSGKSIPGEYHNWPDCVPGGLSRRIRSCENWREARANGRYFHPILLSFARPRLFCLNCYFHTKILWLFGALCSKRVKRLLIFMQWDWLYKARHKGCHAPKLEHIKTLFS